MSKTETKQTAWKCDLCGAVEFGDELPDGWSEVAVQRTAIRRDVKHVCDLCKDVLLDAFDARCR